MHPSFSIEARRCFDRVAERHGLSCIAATERAVRYENGKVFLVVHFDNGRSFELGVEIGLMIADQKERPFSLAEILRLRAEPEAATIDGISAADGNKLAGMLELLADLVQRYAGDFLDGNARSFAEVAGLREMEGIAYATMRNLGLARRNAEKAWRAKDYVAVVAALEPVRAHLSPSEAKRLGYAQDRTKV